MKNLKKVLAVLTAIALMATMCVSVFATESEVTITSAVAEPIDGSSDLYLVTVEFEAAVTNNIGTTLLAYAGKEGDLDETDDAYDETTMKIVGIDQLTDDEAEGTFTFVVSTDDVTAPIYMEAGSTGVVLIGGDSVSVPAAATFTVGELEKPVAETVEIAYVGYDFNISASAPEKIEEKLEELVLGRLDSIEVSVDGAIVSSDCLAKLTADDLAVSKPDNIYQLTIDFPEGFDFGEKVAGEGGISATCDLDGVHWIPISLNVNGGDTVVVENGVEDINAAVLAKITTVIAQAGNGIISAVTNPADCLEVNVPDYDKDETEEQSLTATITLRDNAQFADSFARFGPAQALVYVTVSEKQTPVGEDYVIGDADGSTKVTGTDWAMVLNYVKGVGDKDVFVDPPLWNVRNEASDVIKDHALKGSDWAAILNYVKGVGDPDLMIGTDATYIPED